MMIALFFLLLGAIVLLIAAGRIWMNAPRQTFKETNSLRTATKAWPSRDARPGTSREQTTTRA